MYHDSGKSILQADEKRFRDIRSQNFLQVKRLKGCIFISAYRDTDGEDVYISMTDYEANRLIEHLQKLLNEN